MLSIKKIVCALDLSELSPRVAEYAVSLARVFSAEVVVVYVAPSLNQYAAMEVQPEALANLVGMISVSAEKTMEKVVAEHFAGVKTETKISSGSPAEEIIRAAESAGADLIVMGTHGRTGVGLIIFGSVAEKVVKNSRIPVLTIRPEE